MDIFFERWNDWVKASQRMAKLDSMLVFQLQGLGRLDAQLIANDKVLLLMANKKDPNEKDLLSFNDHYVLSYLWVLGIYELVRTASQIANKSKELKKYREGLKDIKNKIARVRVPLAKLEPANLYRTTDNVIAYPIVHRTMGVGWKVSGNKIIERRTLSDELLNFLKLL